MSEIKALRYNEGKVPISIVPPVLINEVAKVMDFGAYKYDRDNWRKGLSFTNTYDSCQRHLMKWLDGEDIDEESGLPHLAHAATNIAFLLYYTKEEVGADDRFRKDVPEEATKVTFPEVDDTAFPCLDARLY